MIAERVGAYKVFGPPYSGFYRKIGPSFSRVRAALESLTIPIAAFDGSSKVYNQALVSLIERLGEIHSDAVLLERAKAALQQLPASPSTFSFIANYFRIAYREGLAEEVAVKRVMESIPAILLSTAYIPYPSSQGRLLIEGMRTVSPEDSAGLIGKILPQANPDDIRRAVAARFNPLVILDQIRNGSSSPPENENLHRYIWLSKQALLSFAHALTKQFSSEPDPLWVFLMRDAHLLYLIAQKQLPGDKIEIDVGKITLASPQEVASIFEDRGYNIGTAKDTVAIRNYERLIDELGFGAAPSPSNEAALTRPQAVVAELIRREPSNGTAQDFQRFRSAQEILSSLSVPEQIFQLLLTSGIAEAAKNNRPVVFIDTGFKGSLPLLLQAALSRMLTEKGHKPNVHSWLDYAREPFNRFIGVHRCGPWEVSPLDGLVSLNRVIIPGREEHGVEVFTTPFDAARQARIIRPYDRYEASQQLLGSLPS